MGHMILVLGGARSGKSAFAQRLASTLKEPVVYVATATAGDEEMRTRIARHRRMRPKSWRTVEVPVGLSGSVLRIAGRARTLVIDCLSLYVANLLEPFSDNPTHPAAARAILKEVRAVLRELRRWKGTVIVVSNEVGQGVVPSTPLGRAYRDILGEANQLVAKQAEEVYWMVAGVPVRVK